MKIAITDANIFIDLITLQMLTLLFKVGFDIITTKEIIDQLKAIVLTGDGPLRKFCETKRLDVKGLIWLFDEWVEKKLINSVQAAEKMKLLLSYNNRMPKEICEERIKKWMD